MSGKGVTGMGAANRDIRVGRRFKDVDSEDVASHPKNYFTSLDTSLLWDALSFIYEMKGFSLRTFPALILYEDIFI